MSIAVDDSRERAESLAALVDEVADLASPPDICIRVFELLEAPDSSAREIGEVVSQDPSLTAKLLRLVNSPYFGLRRRIDTVSRAIAVLGMHELYGLILAVSAMKSFHRLRGGKGFDIERFWRHNIYCALLARGLARECRVLHPERLFVTGLLHDIGVLILANRRPDEYQELLAEAEQEADLQTRERRHFGFGHADLGEALLRRWSLPEHLTEAVRLHHDPEAIARHPDRLDAALVHLADGLASHLPQAELTYVGEAPEGELDTSGLDWDLLGPHVRRVDPAELVAEAQGEFSGMAAMLMPR